MNRLENYYLAKDALSHMEGMGTGEREIVAYANGVMDMFTRRREPTEVYPELKNATETINLLDEMMSRNGIVEDEDMQRAFDLICLEAIEHQYSLCTPEEYEQWYHDVLTNYGERGAL